MFVSTVGKGLLKIGMMERMISMLIGRREFLRLAAVAVTMPELPKAKTLICGVDMAVGPGSYTMSMVECHAISPTVMRYKLIGVRSGRFSSKVPNIAVLSRRKEW